MILDYSHCIAEAGLKFNKANKYKCPLKLRNGLIYGIYCFSSWLAPALVNSLGPRVAMALAASTYLVQVIAQGTESETLSLCIY